MVRKILVPCLLLGTVPSAGAVDTPCLRYEPASVVLKGKVKQVIFPGPPHYASVQGGDRAEPCWVLYLPSSVCVEGNPKDYMNSETEKNVSELQLIVLGRRKYRKLLGKSVSVKGRLLHAYTWHHHTSVLVQVERMKGGAN